MFVHIYMIIHICIDRCQICCVLQKKWSPWIIERLEKHMEKLMSNKTDETLWHSHQPNGWTPKWLRGNEQMLKLSQVIVSSFTVIFHLKYTTSTFMSSSRISICQSYIHIYIIISNYPFILRFSQNKSVWPQFFVARHWYLLLTDAAGDPLLGTCIRCWAAQETDLDSSALLVLYDINILDVGSMYIYILGMYIYICIYIYDCILCIIYIYILYIQYTVYI